jgi:hypothetical protein
LYFSSISILPLFTILNLREVKRFKDQPQLYKNILTVGTYKLGYPQSTIKKNKNTIHKRNTAKPRIADETSRLRSDSHEASSTGRIDYAPTHTRHPRRDALTASRLVQGPFDKASRLSATSDSHDPGSDHSTYLTHLL